MNVVYLLLGSNLNDRLDSLRLARKHITSAIGKITRESSVYESEPWGFLSENKFLNQVIKVETSFKPLQVLDHILRIETGLGRERNLSRGYASRPMDIDILFYNDEVITDKNLTIPHPRIAERMFTLMPLYEIDKSLIHPLLHKSVKVMIRECTDKLAVNLYHP